MQTIKAQKTPLVVGYPERFCLEIKIILRVYWF